MTVFLADSSIWIAQQRRPATYLRQLLAERIETGQVAACIPIALEVLRGAVDGASYELSWECSWRGLPWLPLDSRASARALDVQRSLAATTARAHRRPPLDFLIAACAETAGEEVILWHWDSNLSVICEHTGQPHEPEHERARAHGLPDPGALSEGSAP